MTPSGPAGGGTCKPTYQIKKLTEQHGPGPEHSAPTWRWRSPLGRCFCCCPPASVQQARRRCTWQQRKALHAVQHDGVGRDLPAGPGRLAQVFRLLRGAQGAHGPDGLHRAHRQLELHLAGPLRRAPAATVAPVARAAARARAAAAGAHRPRQAARRRAGLRRPGPISGGGATSRLLVDYPAAQQEQILDYLFRPSFGASLQILKVEIGGDTLTTDGSESSHMRDNSSVAFDRGYEWWLMQEAKKRNPSIKLYGLPWAFPGWVGTNPATGVRNASAGPYAFPQQTARYVTEWVKGAVAVHGLEIDYLGIWNEAPCDAGYVKLLRQMLDGAGLQRTRLVAADSGSQICTAMKADPALAAAVDVVGLHYPSDFGGATACDGLGKPIWASEESSSYDDLNGAGCWARVVHSHYVLSGITSSIMWNLLGAYYPGTSWFASSMFTAVEPWSGHYSRMPVVWATAHITQFAQVGWRYVLCPLPPAPCPPLPTPHSHPHTPTPPHPRPRP